MSVETAADRAVFFNPAEFGVAATYTPPGVGAVAVPCTLLMGFQDRQLAELRGRAIMKGILASVQKSEISAPVKGGTIVAAGETLIIQGDPQTDEADRLFWSFTLA